MKQYIKIIFMVFSISTVSTLFAGAPQWLYLPEEKVYMEVEINGDKLGKWMSIYSVEEYDVKARLLRKNHGYRIDEYKYYGDANKPIYVDIIEGDSVQ